VAKTPAPLLLTNSPTIDESEGAVQDADGEHAASSDDSNKEQWTTSVNFGSADQAGAVAQPHQT
jgi:hypothetical protein